MSEKELSPRDVLRKKLEHCWDMYIKLGKKEKEKLEKDFITDIDGFCFSVPELIYLHTVLYAEEEAEEEKVGRCVDCKKRHKKSCPLYFDAGWVEPQDLTTDEGFCNFFAHKRNNNSNGDIGKTH